MSVRAIQLPDATLCRVQEEHTLCNGPPWGGLDDGLVAVGEAPDGGEEQRARLPHRFRLNTVSRVCRSMQTRKPDAHADRCEAGCGEPPIIRTDRTGAEWHLEALTCRVQSSDEDVGARPRLDLDRVGKARSPMNGTKASTKRPSYGHTLPIGLHFLLRCLMY